MSSLSHPSSSPSKGNTRNAGISLSYETLKILDELRGEVTKRYFHFTSNRTSVYRKATKGTRKQMIQDMAKGIAVRLPPMPPLEPIDSRPIKTPSLPTIGGGDVS